MAPRDQLIVATAANVQFAMEEIVRNFTKETGVKCDIIISSSGKITAQILEGAPFDVFISADMQYPQRIFDAGLASEQPLVYARGKLVLWSIEQDISDVEEIKNTSVNHIAMANPEIAPYGKATQQVLEYYEIYDDIKEKLVFGESVAQVNQFILSEAVAAGFTAQSVVLSPKLANRGHWIDIDPKTYNPIDQGLIIIKNSKHLDSARKFRDFLLSKNAVHILEEYGYTTFKN